MSKPTCPDCRTPLTENGHDCACGWITPQKILSDKQRHYQYAGQRCPQVGTITPHIGADALWYCCSSHMQPVADPEAAQNLLHQLLKQHIHRSKKGKLLCH